VSVGSTPTLSVAEDLSGVTEARPGNYAFYDGAQATIGSCELSDVAFSVLATVIGHYPEQGRIVINAGALALSKDPGPTHVDARCGYGTLCSLDGQPLPGLTLVATSQEHGEVRCGNGRDATRYPLGAHLRIVPNHSCLTAAAYDRYYVVRGERVIDEWRPVKGW
jgi:D-serine deaminase-like pyridoxal phosphate-dependent protein